LKNSQPNSVPYRMATSIVVQWEKLIAYYLFIFLSTNIVHETSVSEYPLWFWLTARLRSLWHGCWLDRFQAAIMIISQEDDNQRGAKYYKLYCFSCIISIYLIYLRTNSVCPGRENLTPRGRFHFEFAREQRGKLWI